MCFNNILCLCMWDSLWHKMDEAHSQITAFIYKGTYELAGKAFGEQQYQWCPNLVCIAMPCDLLWQVCHNGYSREFTPAHHLDIFPGL